MLKKKKTKAKQTQNPISGNETCKFVGRFICEKIRLLENLKDKTESQRNLTSFEISHKPFPRQEYLSSKLSRIVVSSFAEIQMLMNAYTIVLPPSFAKSRTKFVK